MLCETPDLSRRSVLLGSGALFAWSFMPKLASASTSTRDPRLLVIVLRGGLDGLSAVPPVGDPAYAALRGGLAMSTSGPGAAVPLDGIFALNAAMPEFLRLYRAGQASVIQAAASPYRERSHFDGQDVLESGIPSTGGRDGWMARALGALPKGAAVAPVKGLSIGLTTPLIMRGPAEITTWAPQTFPYANDDTIRRLMSLYEARDPALARALRGGVETEAVSKTMGETGRNAGVGDPVRAFPDQAAAAARFMAMPNGPRLGTMSFDGWDTHAQQGPRDGRLARLLGALDSALAAFERGMGPAWKDTVVAVITEFGRTARENGTDGTDHGTATTAFLAGGALNGGKVISDWPGLAPNQLYQNRDLAPTTDLRAVLKGVLADHIGMPESILSRVVFPGSETVKPMKDLLRA